MKHCTGVEWIRASSFTAAWAGVGGVYNGVPSCDTVQSDTCSDEHAIRTWFFLSVWMSTNLICRVIFFFT